MQERLHYIVKLRKRGEYLKSQKLKIKSYKNYFIIFILLDIKFEIFKLSTAVHNLST